MPDRSEYKAVFGELRRRVKAVSEPGALASDPALRAALSAALDAAGELIHREGLRRRTDSCHTGSLRPDRIYLEEIDESRVIRAAGLLGIPAPLLPPTEKPRA
jgi:hypothetical protein